MAGDAQQNRPLGVQLKAAELAAGAHNEMAATRPACYTSFDGDFIEHVGRMCWVAMALGFTPINPEAVLGYFVSTESLGGSKQQVMRACVAAEFKASEFWICTPRGETALRDLSEGVVAEYLLWRRQNPTLPVRHFEILDDLGWRQFKSSGKPIAEVLSSAELTDAEHATIVAAADRKGTTADLDANFVGEVASEGTWPVAFVSSDPLDDKHLDWARAALYKLDPPRVPFVPNLMLPGLARDFLVEHDLEQQELAPARQTLIEKADELWIFVQPSVKDGRAEIPADIMRDLAAWHEIHPDGHVHMVGWDDCEVPKYVDPNWALTEHERGDEHT